MSTLFELDEMLHPQVITKTYRQQASLRTANPLVAFYGTQAEDYSGDRFDFVYHSPTREPAPANFRGQPARVLQPSGSSTRRVSMFHAFNEIDLSLEALQMIRRPEDRSLQERGRDEIRRQMVDFGDRHFIFRAVCLAKTLTDGVVYLDSAGRVLESVSGATVTVDFGVDPSHKEQLDNGEPAIADSWDDPDAKILDQLDQIRIRAEEENAERPQHIWLHHAMKASLRDNTQLQSYIKGSPEAVDRILAGSMIPDLNGWTWHFYSGTYIGADGQVHPYIPKDKLVITPDVGPWLRAANGSEMLPTIDGIRPTMETALAELHEAFGDFAYVVLRDNPAKLVLRMGTNFVYAFANPAAVWMPTVIFK